MSEDTFVNVEGEKTTFFLILFLNFEFYLFILAMLCLCCCAQAFSSQLQFAGLVASRHVGSSQIRDRTHVSCTARPILSHSQPLDHQGSPLWPSLTIMTRRVSSISSSEQMLLNILECTVWSPRYGFISPKCHKCTAENLVTEVGGAKSLPSFGSQNSSEHLGGRK